MIYVYDDPSKWGREVAMACGRAGNRTTYTMGWQWDHIAWVLKRMMEEANG